MNKFDLKSIFMGIAIGIICTTSFFFLIGDIDVEIELGRKDNTNHENK
tara:strand:+ start:2073 stop:2216 length:144 start_codon:yes stop_codon:yes gene_type:complete